MGRFLIVEDDELLARVFTRELGGAERVIVARTIEEASQIYRTDEELLGAVVDICLPDGSGLDVVRDLKAEEPALPVLVVTGSIEHTAINETQRMGAEFVAKPACRDNLRAFAKRANWARQSSSDVLASFRQRFCDAHKLTPRESELLDLSLRGVRRRGLAAALGVTEATVKQHVHSLLLKTTYDTLADLVADVLREAWGLAEVTEL